MLHTLIASTIVIVGFGALFMVVTVVRDKYMGAQVPRHFGECGGCKAASSCGTHEPGDHCATLIAEAAAAAAEAAESVEGLEPVEPAAGERSDAPDMTEDARDLRK